MKNRLHRVLELTVVAFALALSTTVANAQRAGSRDIVYSARYYLKAGQKGASYYHLFRINADGSAKRQITFGKHNDEAVMWSPNGKKIAFVRDDQTLMLADQNGQNLLPLLKSSSSGWEALRWSPDGRNIGFLSHETLGKTDVDLLNLLDVKTRKIVRLRNVERYAWSPDNRKLLLLGGVDGLRVLDLPSMQTRKLKLDVARFAWIAPQRWIAAVSSQTGDEMPILKAFALFNTKGETLKTFSPAAYADGNEFNWRSYVAPIRNDKQNFLFALDQSTSSGYEAIYHRVSAATGKMTRLADGQFFAFAPGGKAFLNVTYHDTTPYDTLRNGHKRVVYTTKLQVGTSEKTLRDIVAGLVLVDNADWRAPR